MGGDSSKPKQPALTKCANGQHVKQAFECPGEDCENSPLLCEKCAYKSIETEGLLICKLCKVAENMRDEEDDSDSDDIDTSTGGVTLVSSVSYDK